MIGYQAAISNNTPRDAFIRLLERSCIEETPASLEEIGQASNDDLIQIGQHYIDQGGDNLKEHFEKFQDEPDFFERFKKAFVSYTGEVFEPFKSLYPELNQLAINVRTPLENAVKSIQGIIHSQPGFQAALQNLQNLQTLNGIKPKSLYQLMAPYKQAVTSMNIVGSPASDAAKNMLDYSKSIAPTRKPLPSVDIPNFEHPSVRTNDLMKQIINENKEQREENRDIQQALVAGIGNLIQAQIESSKQSNEQFTRTNNQNKLIIGLTTIGIILSVILGVSGFLTTVFTSAIHDFLIHLFGKYHTFFVCCILISLATYTVV